MKNPKQFILSLYNGDGSFSYSTNNEIANLYSTCFGVMCLDLINELDNFNDKNKVIELIQSYQNECTGCFIDKTAIPETEAKHNQEYVRLQLTDFAQLALSALNSKARYEYKFLTKYKDKNYLKKWFYVLDWKSPWLISNAIMFILNCFIYEDEEKNKEYIDYIIELLNENQDRRNGFWNLGNKVNFHNQMAGAYHFIFFYTYLGIKPNYIEKIINSTLAIQNYDGLFSYSTGGGSCDDLDAIDLLCRATFYIDYRKDEIKKALTKTYKSLLKNQNKDGGFCWAKRNVSMDTFLYLVDFNLLFNVSFKDFLSNFIEKSKIILYKLFFPDKLRWKYSGLDSMKLRVDQSDLFSTWFRLTSVAFIEMTFPEIYYNRKSLNWSLRKKCGLGFYKK